MKTCGRLNVVPRVFSLFDSFNNAKEDAISAIKTVGRLRDPRDAVGGRFCHRSVLTQKRKIKFDI